MGRRREVDAGGRRVPLPRLSVRTMRRHAARNPTDRTPEMTAIAKRTMRGAAMLASVMSCVPRLRGSPITYRAAQPTIRTVDLGHPLDLAPSTEMYC